MFVYPVSLITRSNIDFKRIILGYTGVNCDRRTGLPIWVSHSLRYVIIALVSLMLIAILVFGVIQMKRKGRSVKMKIKFFIKNSIMICFFS